MEDNRYPFGIIEEDEGWLLLEQKTINKRTLISWYNPNSQTISLFLFHNTEKPNEFSQRATPSVWGYPTYFVTNMMTTKEASEVVSLYLQDMEKDNFWWEKD